MHMPVILKQAEQKEAQFKSLIVESTANKHAVYSMATDQALIVQFYKDY